MLAFKCHDPPTPKTSEGCARLNQDRARDLLELVVSDFTLNAVNLEADPEKVWTLLD